MQDVSVKPNEMAEVRCDIFGFPTSTVVFAFIPCEKVEFDRQSCDQNQRITYAVSVAPVGDFSSSFLANSSTASPITL